MQEIIGMAHPTEDALERFVMRKSADLELEVVESHVIGCQDCLDRVSELEIFVQACRDALPVFRQEHALKPAKASAAKWFRELIPQLPKWSWAPALAVVALLGVILPNLHQPTGSRFDAILRASRGIETSPVLPRRTVIRLHLDAIDLPAGLVDVEVVDAEGLLVWSGSSAAQADQVTAETPRLESGTYFARLYPMPDGHVDRTRLLREFAFQVK
jgi:hypothetical protein